MLAKEAERRVGDFNMQGLTITARALAMAGWSETPLFATIAAEMSDGFSSCLHQDLCMSLWTLSQRETMTHAWIFMQHVNRTGHCVSPLCFEPLFTASEQRGLIDCEIALLEELERMARKDGTELSCRLCRPAAKHVAVMRLAMSSEVELQDLRTIRMV
eukprot:gnl/TRDRNA2_/TRDRNA2_116927_c1_seq1.p2 gnl/TRDRNA2_/TRDRNA2_116927_c1~~gnl/TRDRNA2_/TRDRNA2_116927_c1_seq1.p2  ORF type:complete len:159 (+),score=17.76 gnl/TRDRNA2_/TRDRNA2_116927_c1_seq1:563-1039(+)